MGVTSSGNAANAAEEAPATLNALLAVEEVALTAELAELLRWRNMTWSLIPPLSRKLVLPYLTVKETLRLDTSVTETGDEENPRDRDHLVKAYKGLRSGGFDEWVFKDTNSFEGVRWARERGVDLQNLKLEYKGERDADQVLGQLVVDFFQEDMATYYAARSEARDTDVIANVDYVHVDSTTLIEALRYGNLVVAQCLLDRGADVNKADSRGETPLQLASRDGHVEVVKTLLAAKAEVDAANDYGMTPLHRASSGGHIEVVNALLAAKADVNSSDHDGGTPLCMASIEGHVEVVKVLLAAEAEMDITIMCPLYVASEYGQVEVVKALIAAKADVNKGCLGSGRTPLHGASCKGQVEVVKTLIASKAEVDKADKSGDTPLCLASRDPLYFVSYEWHVEVMKALLAAKADVNKADSRGKTPLYWALHYKRSEVVTLLRAAGATE